MKGNENIHGETAAGSWWARSACEEVRLLLQVQGRRGVGGGAQYVKGLALTPRSSGVKSRTSGCSVQGGQLVLEME